MEKKRKTFKKKGESLKKKSSSWRKKKKCLSKGKQVSSDKKKKIITKRKRNLGKRWIWLLEGGTILLLVVLIGVKEWSYRVQLEEKLEQEYLLVQKHYEEVRKSYNKFVKTEEEISLYKRSDDGYVEIGKISEGTYLVLADISMETYQEDYYKLENNDYYVEYSSVVGVEEETVKENFKNYIPFNENVITDDSFVLEGEDGSYYQINESMDLMVYIKDNDSYGVVFDNELFYLKKNDVVEVVTRENTQEEVASSIAVLNYHFVISYEDGEQYECLQSICSPDYQFEEHMAYIKEKGYYTPTMREFDLFIDGKLQLPKKSVLITIDDGWYVARSIAILQKYDLMATLFLIGSLAAVTDYASPNLEVHSHTWDLHYIASCDGLRGPINCVSDEVVLEDLKKSRESLDNTPYFCWPFYEYTSHSMELIKEAGFTLSFIGGNKKAEVGSDRYKVPRYVIFNTTTLEQLISYLN